MPKSQTFLYLQQNKEHFLKVPPFSGAHQMEPPSPLISWVKPFPSRFFNRTACFPRKVSYFRESRMSPWKNKVGWSRTQKPVLRPFSFFIIRPFLRLQPLGSGYHETKVNELLNDWAWSDGTKAANWGPRKGYLCECCFLAVIHLTCKHALRKESTIKRSVDDLELFDDQHRKSTWIIWFYVEWSGFLQLSTACKSDDLSSLRKHPFLLALRRRGRFARRNVCDSATEIPYWWRNPMFT